MNEYRFHLQKYKAGRNTNAAEGNALSGMLTKKVRLSSPTMWEDATMRIRVVIIIRPKTSSGTTQT